MYQACYYDRKTNECYVRDDVQGWQYIEKFIPTYYKRDNNGPFETIFGDRVKPVSEFEKGSKDYFEVDIDPTLRVLTQLYGASDDIPTSHNIVFYDIEAEMGGALTIDFIESAPMPMTSVALYDKNSKVYYALIVDKDGIVQTQDTEYKKVFAFRTEKQMLYFFLDLWEKLDPTIICGWNCDWYDNPYTYYRIKRVLGKEQASRLSPLRLIERAYSPERMEKDGKRPKQLIRIHGVSSADYMRLHKKFIPKVQASYSLDYICRKEIGRGKITYKGNLNDLFRTDIDKYIDYNLNDVELVVLLDEKLQFIQLMLMICHISHTTYENIYFSSVIIDGAIYTSLKRKNIVSPNKPITNNPELKKEMDDNEDRDKFKGAYVKDPITGLHDWLTDEDLAQLYPSIIRSLNIGIESMVGRVCMNGNTEVEQLSSDKNALYDIINSDDSKLTVEMVSGERKFLTPELINKTIIGKKYAISGNGIIFNQNKTSVISQILGEWSDKRDYYKNLKNKAAKEGDYDLKYFYDNYQKVFKTFSNSIYGVLALVSFRYTDENKWLSTAVTLSGQVIIKNSIRMINERLNRELGSVDVDFVVASDTDSMFIKCFDIVKKRIPDVDVNDEERIIPVVIEIAHELRDIINNYYDELAVTHFNSKKHYLKIKPEYVIKKAYWSDKKKYACYIVDNEGARPKPGEEWDFKGLDLMKSNFPEKFKIFSEGMLKGILTGKTKKDVDKSILNFKKDVLNCPIEELLLPVGINELNKYIDATPLPGKIFSKPKSGCNAHIKAAMFYNDLLAFKGLDKKFPAIQSGDKIFYSYLTKNPYNIEVIGFQRDEKPDEIWKILEKYANREKNFQSQLLEKLQKVYTTLNWGTINLNPNKDFLEDDEDDDYKELVGRYF